MALRAQAAAGKLLSDLKSLKFSALFPIRHWISEKPWAIGWIQALCFLAFYPLAVSLLSSGQQDLTDELKTSAWALGLYFAVIWGAILYRTVKPGKIEPRVIVSTFFFTALIGITLVPVIRSLPIFSQIYAAKTSDDVELQLFGYIFGVGVTEESVKALPLIFWYLIQKRPGTPREIAFAGVLSGLAFGVAEAVGYSILYANSQISGEMTPGSALIIQSMRMISLPLLHALWAGIAGYFIGLAAQFQQRKAALILVGIGLVALIHGLYDTFSETWFAFGLCVLSLLLYIMYMRSAERIAEELHA
jgi:RsiW-degrading membrane proteinase PrsW (M82 family)